MTEDNTERVELTTEQILLVRQGAERLRHEFDGTFNAETIERYMHSSQELLQAKAKFSMWLPLLIERVTRDRLRALARLEVGTLGKPAVLFLCVHNAGRSQMGAGWLRHLVGDRVDVFSGGTDPGIEINGAAAQAMAEVGIDIGSELPQPWTDEIARAADVIVSMGCGDACPIYPGKRYEDWDLIDPTDQPLEVVREIRDNVRARVEALIATLELDVTASAG
ncbi:arsenate reductase ArsC [Ilumatobacter nonamiensis]|uniref:arsenate reductase ArsC n=1 Tax=Ilumatobacter nonamiensis TaxID=467093 RepID=UPI00058F1DE9|nr:arsenate reductase ArsC [Ilumatobacter nonamiensis]